MSWQQRDLTLDHGFSGAVVFMSRTRNSLLREVVLYTIGGHVASPLHCWTSARKFPFSPSKISRCDQMLPGRQTQTNLTVPFR